MMFRKLLILVLAAALTLGFSAKPVLAEPSYTLITEPDETGEGLVITGFSGTAEGELILPEEIEGVPVTAIGGQAFKDAAGFTGGLRIPACIRTIGKEAFAGCSGMTGVLSIGADTTDGSVNYLADLGPNAFMGAGFTAVCNFTDVTVTAYDIIPMDSMEAFFLEGEEAVCFEKDQYYVRGEREPVDIQFAFVEFHRPIFYQGEPVEPDFILRTGPNEDDEVIAYWTVEVTDNDAVGTASATFKGDGIHTLGEFTIYFNIFQDTVENAEITGLPEKIVFANQEAFEACDYPLDPQVVLGEEVLVKDTDYELTFALDDEGCPALTIRGIDRFTGTVVRTFEYSIEESPAQPEDPEPVDPEPIDPEPTDPEPEPEIDPVPSPAPVPISISKASVTIKTQTYTGKALTPTPTVKLEGKKLVKDTDFTVTYKNNKKAGTATATIKGIGAYTGKKKVTFTIQSKSIKKVKITGLKTLTYTGKARTQKLVLMDGETKLTKGKSYKLLYRSNVKAGKASVTISGKGNYTGRVVKYFNIRPKKPAIASLKNSSKGTVKVQWAKAPTGDGYEVQLSSKKTFKSARKATLTKLSKVKTGFKGLKKGTVYYVRMRTYKRIDSKKVYSEWSKVKTVKVTK